MKEIVAMGGGERWHDFAKFEPRVDLSERTENLGTPYAQGAVADIGS